MKKQEILTLLEENDVSSTNLTTFLNRKKKLNLNFDRVQKWLIEVEKFEEEKAEKFMVKKQAKKFNMSVKLYLALQNKARLILKDFDTEHSMGCYKYLRMNGAMFTSDNNTSEYSNGCKYKATHGEVYIKFSKKELINVEEVEGVWTIKDKNHKAKWLVSSGSKYSYSVDFEDGYLFGNSHGDTLTKAKETFKKRYQQERREYLNDKKFIGMCHLKDLGACDAGIKAFAERNSLNLEMGYNLAYLKGLEVNSFLNRL